MSKKSRIFNLIILDESGSMQSIKEQTVSGFNELVQSIRSAEEKLPNQKHFVSFVTFNSDGIKTHLDCRTVRKLKPIRNSNYRPSAMTPLYDAIGISLRKLGDHLSAKAENKVLVTILTDGLENASSEYSLTSIKSLIESYESQGWTFTYIGTDHDVHKVAKALSINNSMMFHKSKEGIEEMWVKERKYRHAFYEMQYEGSWNKDAKFFRDTDEEVKEKRQGEVKNKKKDNKLSKLLRI